MAAPQSTGADPPRECDVVVVGAGIVGLATARELGLRHREASVAVLEREGQVAAHQSGHSSGVIHAGIYYRPGSLKARLCVEGARELYDYCERRGIPTRRDGKLIVATHEGELPGLAELERRGRANGVAGLRRIGPEELSEIEPHAHGVAALHSPETGVVDFTAVADALARELTSAGGSIHLGCEVRSTTPRGRRIEIAHARGRIGARATVLCAGAWSDRLAVAAGAPKEPRVVPFRGAFSRLRPERRHLVRASIYPVPDPDLPFLGVHMTRAIDGEVHVGPSALMPAPATHTVCAESEAGIWFKRSPGPGPGDCCGATGAAPWSKRAGRCAAGPSSPSCGASFPSSLPPISSAALPAFAPRRLPATAPSSTTS